MDMKLDFKKKFDIKYSGVRVKEAWEKHTSSSTVEWKVVKNDPGLEYPRI